MNSYDYTDRVAIVTGGGQGIGLTVAERMLASGGSVSIWDRDQALLDALDSKYGSDGKVQTLKVDIGDLPVVEAATAAVKSRFGKIDVLINNAAIVGPNMPTWEYPPQAFMDVRPYRPRRHLLLLPGRGAAHDRAELRAHRQPQLRGGQGRQSQRAGLFLHQGRRAGAHQVAGQGTRRLRHRREAVTPAVAKTTMALARRRTSST